MAVSPLPTVGADLMVAVYTTSRGGALSALDATMLDGEGGPCPVEALGFGPRATPLAQALSHAAGVTVQV
jgi:hypothetical protein